MSIATKGGAVILKDGKAAEDCGCCGGCLVWKTQGWDGWLNDIDSNEFNGDGAVVVNNLSLPCSVTLSNTNKFVVTAVIASDSIYITLGNAVRLGVVGVVTLSKEGPHGLLDGQVVEVSNVVSNTFLDSTDEYNRKAIESVGSVFLKLERGSKAKCGADCSPNFYEPSYNTNISYPGFFNEQDTPSTPLTMTLRFTNLSARPDGPRWPSPGSPYYGGYGDYQLGKYAGFLPPNSVREYFAPYTVRTGCDSYMPRFEKPIILRRVNGLFYTYLSDPINIKPCTQVQYRFDACRACLNSYDCSSGPRLSVADISNTSQFTKHPSANIWADRAIENWGRSSFLENPTVFAEQKTASAYLFGNFATVTPGGEYQPEQQLLCGGLATDKYSLAEGCGGTKCPPTEISLEVVTGGSIAELAGTYVLPLVSQACFTHAGSFNPDNYFSGFRPYYRDSFNKSTINITFSVVRFETSGFQWIAPDICGCDGRPVGLFVTFSPLGGGYSGSASINATRYPNTGNCLPICCDNNCESVFKNVGLQQRNLDGSTFPNIGDIIVRW